MQPMSARDQTISIRLTAAELDELKAEADSEGLPVGAVIRRRLFWSKPPEPGEVVTEVPMKTTNTPGSWAARHPRQAAIDQMLSKPKKEPKT